MPIFRPDIREITPYSPGRSIESIAAERGLDPDTIVKLASNEHAESPLPSVVERIADEAPGVNRYPDNDAVALRQAIGAHVGVPQDHVWVGGGSSELLRVIAMATGGPGTSAVYGWPSFVIYRLGSKLAMTTPLEVPLVDHTYDLEEIAAAIREDTTVVYVCNPNNPTGTHLPADAIAGFVESVPDRVLVVIDEAYHEYVTADDHRTAVPLAVERPNVVVTRTFSKIHGLASLRVGYGIARPEVISELRKAQAPFTVTSLGQAAAITSLEHTDEIDARCRTAAGERRRIETALREMGLEPVESQANFVAFDGSALGDPAAAYLDHGLIVRVFGSWVRVTIGTAEQNDRFIAATRSLMG